MEICLEATVCHDEWGVINRYEPMVLLVIAQEMHRKIIYARAG